uniref:Glycolipid transfer protein domain-containing protein n=1 Tax=Acrobeloides nanus TaxID=290746 RepID=A0A914D885_9BILA
MTDTTEKETYFSHTDRMFPELHDDDRIPTEQFLIACQGIADFVGFLGTAFSPVKSDIAGNVKKVRTKFETDKERMKYLQDLIDIDLNENNGKLGVATEGLLWLKRGLEFMLQLLRLMVFEYNSNIDKSQTETIVGILRQAYEKTLKRHHNFVAKQLFKVLIHAAPYRKDILKAVALGNEGLEDVCIRHIDTHLDNFGHNVNSLVNYYYAKNLETRP